MEEYVIMRVALCISGQPRTWKKTYLNWLENLLPNIEKDIFFHFWDYNTLPAILESQANIVNVDVPITEKEKQEIVSTLQPKKYMFDSRNLNPNQKSTDSKLMTDYVKNPIGWWCRNQFYSLHYAANLKRQYEIENRFEYDVVFRMRSDLYFLSQLNMPSVVSPNRIYSKSNGYMDNVETFMIGDTFYFSDSYTYDQTAEFIYALSFIDTTHVVPSHVECPPPETALYPYLCASGIKNVSCPQHIKIMRTQEYIDIKGELAAYEII